MTRGTTLRTPLRTFEVTGESMLPTLCPGDWLVVRTGERVRARVRIGDVVIARHPGEPDRLIVKRISGRTADGWWLESDNQRAAGRQDSWDFDAVPDRLLVGRVVGRYRPLRRWASAGSFRRR
jgi:nickel-type superoxide dismutase maturation protease